MEYLKQRAVLLGLGQATVFFAQHLTTVMTFLAVLYLEDVHLFKASNVFTIFTFAAVLSFYMRMFQCLGYSFIVSLNFQHGSSR